MPRFRRLYLITASLSLVTGLVAAPAVPHAVAVSETGACDVSTGTTTRISVDSSGTQANGNSDDVAISADGSTIVYVSSASNLVPGDTNGQGVNDVWFVVDAAGDAIGMSG